MNKNAKKPPPSRAAVGLITRGEAAKMKGVLPSAISMACRVGGPLHPAVRGRLVDSTHPAFAEWMSSNRGDTELRDLAVRKRAAEVSRLELANAEREGLLISRELVRTHVIGLVDATNRRLLTDVPRTIVARIAAGVRAGRPTETLELEVRELISRVLRDCRDRAVRALQEERSAEPS